MIHQPIQFNNLGLSFPHKICFENFSGEIRYGERIAIIGRNGSGKTSLLNLLQNIMRKLDNVHFGYVPQLIESYTSLSGAQRFNEILTQALASGPNILLLDEPTNHLDIHNRKSLMRMLNQYSGTLIAVSHDMEFLRRCIDTIWHIDNAKIQTFTGDYDDYIGKITQQRVAIENELDILHRQKKEMHKDLMQEQARAKQSKLRGQKSINQRKWPTIVSHAKAGRAEETSGRKKNAIHDKKQILLERLSELQLPEVIRPKFSLCEADITANILVSIHEGTAGYTHPILNKIYLSVSGNARVALCGNNGCGKTTLIKALLNDLSIKKSGDWYVPQREHIGYLDQHYSTLDPTKTVVETMQLLRSTWSHAEIRRHLNDFLFRKNEEVNALVATLSGGEKTRLSLAQIAAQTPKLLILDEITNNLDLETRQHVIDVLNAYPGAIIVVSHDENFLNQINITHFINVENMR